MAKFLASQKKRRKKMHGRRRKQETLGVTGLIGTLVLIPFGVSWWIVTTLLAVAGAVLVASRATPPADTKPVKNGTRNTAASDKRVRAGTVRVGVTGKERGKKRPCSASCQYSRKSRSTCDCSCGGSLHGISAPKKLTRKRK